MCDFCGGERMPWASAYATMQLGEIGSMKTLMFKFSKCPEYVKETECSTKGMDVTTAFPISFCPICGANMEETDND